MIFNWNIYGSGADMVLLKKLRVTLIGRTTLGCSPHKTLALGL